MSSFEIWKSDDNFSTVEKEYTGELTNVNLKLDFFETYLYMFGLHKTQAALNPIREANRLNISTDTTNVLNTGIREVESNFKGTVYLAASGVVTEDLQIFIVEAVIEPGTDDNELLDQVWRDPYPGESSFYMVEQDFDKPIIGAAMSLGVEDSFNLIMATKESDAIYKIPVGTGGTPYMSIASKIAPPGIALDGFVTDIFAPRSQ